MDAQDKLADLAEAAGKAVLPSRAQLVSVLLDVASTALGRVTMVRGGNEMEDPDTRSAIDALRLVAQLQGFNYRPAAKEAEGEQDASKMDEAEMDAVLVEHLRSRGFNVGKHADA